MGSDNEGDDDADKNITVCLGMSQCSVLLNSANRKEGLQIKKTDLSADIKNR